MYQPSYFYFLSLKFNFKSFRIILIILLIRNCLSPPVTIKYNPPNIFSHTPSNTHASTTHTPNSKFLLLPPLIYDSYQHSHHIKHVDKQSAVLGKRPPPPLRVSPSPHPHLPTPSYTEYSIVHMFNDSRNTRRMRKLYSHTHCTFPRNSFTQKYSAGYILPPNSEHFYSDIWFANFKSLSILFLILSPLQNQLYSYFTIIIFKIYPYFSILNQILYFNLLTVDQISQFMLYSHTFLSLNFKGTALHNTHTHFLLLLKYPSKSIILVKQPHNMNLHEIITITFRLANHRTKMAKKIDSVNPVDMVFEESVEQQKTYVHTISIFVNSTLSQTYLPTFCSSLTYKFNTGRRFHFYFLRVLTTSPRKIKSPQT